MRILIAALALFVSFAAYAENACPSMQWTLVDEMAAPQWVPTIQSVDFDEDGKLDLVGVAQGGSTRHLLWWKGAGDGTFGEPVELGTGSFMSNVVIADATGDGRLDVLVVVYGETGAHLWTYPSTGSGRTQLTQPFTSIPHTLIAPNMDADPEAELVASWGWSGFTVYDRISGGYSQTQNVNSSGSRQITSADFDGDGRFDIAVARPEPRNEGAAPTDRIDVYFRNADGSFGTPLPLYTPQPWAVTSGDIDADGKPDLVIGNWIQATLDPGTITIYRNTGDRTFAASVLVTERPGPPTNVSDPIDVDIIDMNADGHADILVTVVNGSWIATFSGLGDGTFRAPTFLSGYSTSSMTTNDFNGDGVRDLAVGTNDTVLSFARSCMTQVSLYAESYLISAGQQAILRARISGFHPGVAAPRGTVSLREDQTELATADVQADGWVAFDIAGLSAGDHNLYAVFSGNSEIAGATSATVLQRVTNIRSTLSVTLPHQTVHGRSFPVDFKIANIDYGYVEVSVDGGPKQVRYTSVPLVLTLPAGPHSITARYLGTTYLPKSDPVTVNFTTAKEFPWTAAGHPAAVREGSTCPITMTVRAHQTFDVPTGNVQLYEDGTTWLASAALVDGTATFSRTFSRGSHAIRVVYDGDAGYHSVSYDLRIDVLPNVAFPLDARSLPNGIRILAIPADGTDAATLQLQRRVTGTSSWQNVPGFTGLPSMSGVDTTVARGLAYDYRMIATLYSGSPIVSSTDSAVFFTEDPLTAGTLIKRTHFTELATAVNLLRAQANLAPFSFDASFTTEGVVRASHLTSLRSALMQARTTLGMTAPALSSVNAGGTVQLLHMIETRDLAR
jgi:hypothetical protein